MRDVDDITFESGATIASMTTGANDTPMNTTNMNSTSNKMELHSTNINCKNTPAQRLLSLINNENEMLICPGVYDGISARVALSAGARALYMTGAGTASSLTGLPDVGCATLVEMQANAQMIAGLDPQVPVISDADTGYGGSTMCARTLRMFAQAGVAAIHVEDQVLSKRCGHLGGKQVVSCDEYVQRIKFMAEERARIGSDILIITRSDALQNNGLEDAIDRCHQAVKAGADVVFVEGILDKDQAVHITSYFAQHCPNIPVLVNLVANGLTPNWTAKQAQSLGFHLAIYPCATMVPAMVAMQSTLKHLLSEGTDVCGEHKSTTVKDFFMQMGLGQIVDLEKRIGGPSSNNL